MRRKLLLTAIVLPIAALTATGVVRASGVTAADTVFLNGKIFTADAKDSVVQAFAIRQGKFEAVGTSQAIRRFVGPRTKVVDLKGAFVSPGLTDNHFHNEGGGTGIDLTHVRSMQELLTVVANTAASAPKGSLIVSNSDWHEAQLKEQRLPTVAELDMAAPSTPVVLVRGGHSVILNSAALKKWNITKDTPVPPGGAISRDSAGELTGEMIDAAKSLISLPRPKPVTMEDIMATQKAVAPYGMTAVRVPGGYKGDMVQAYRLMKQAEAAGSLTLRYTLYMPGFGLKSAADVKPLIDSWGVKQDEGDEWVRIGGIKLLVDGGFEGGHMSQPYKEPWGKGGTYYGLTVVQPAAYTGIVREINRLGWRATTHAAGDAAVQQVLDAYEAADKDHSIAGKRWAVEHASVSRPEQRLRLKKLDIAVSTQDHLYIAGPVLKKYYGEPTADEFSPVKSYLDAGLLVSSGTDSPVIPFNPFWGLYHLMSRDTVSDGVYGADQRVLSRPLLLKLVTINYAKTIGEEKTRGSIEPGKLADFAVLTGDFLKATPSQVRDMRALATFVGGKEVYRSRQWKQ